MIRQITGFLLFLFSLSASAQTFDLDSAIARSEGKFKTISYRSAVSGLKKKVKVKKGRWNYYNEDDVLLLSQHFVISGNSSVLDGELHYYTETGALFKTDFYKYGRLVESTFFTAYDYTFQKKRHVIYPDPAGFLAEKVFDEDGKQIGQTGNLVGQTPVINEVEERRWNLHLAKEKKLGDTILLERKPIAPEKQNLIKNSSFEESQFDYSVTSIRNDQVKHWEVASPSPDFYISPRLAYDGNSYVGFRVYSFTNHIEYLRAPLKKPLQAGKTYCMTMRVRLSKDSRVVSNILGVYFTNNRWESEVNAPFPDPQITMNNHWLVYKSEWMTLQCSFTAEGGERYAHIGTFRPPEGISLLETTGSRIECYYWIDAVSLVETDDCPCNIRRDQLKDPFEGQDTTIEITERAPKPGDSWVLEDVYFEIDKDELLPKSEESLNRLFDLLVKHDSIRISIQGHTSSTGDYEHNVDLSDRRAISVMNYLVQKGIDENRLEHEGFGPDQPIATNDTEEGRSKNRRVEINVLP